MTIAEQVKKIIIDANQAGATDVIFTPLENNVSLTCKINENVISQQTISNEAFYAYARYLKFSNDRNVGAAVLNDSNNKRIFSEMTIPSNYKSEPLSIFILPKKSREITGDLQPIYEQIRNEKGLYIFSGISGSGKTNSAYTVLEKLHRDDNKSVSTVENSLEIIIDDFAQAQINEDFNITYDIGIKAVARMDCDIMYVGEIYDESTVKAIQKQLDLGKTVISTMPYESFDEVIEQLQKCNMYSFEIEKNLIGVSSQTLDQENNNITYTTFDKSQITRSIVANADKKEKFNIDVYNAFGVINRKIEEASGTSGITLRDIDRKELLSNYDSRFQKLHHKNPETVAYDMLLHYIETSNESDASIKELYDLTVSTYSNNTHNQKTDGVDVLNHRIESVGSEINNSNLKKVHKQTKKNKM